MAAKTARDIASSASVHATKACVLDPAPAMAGVEPSGSGAGESVSRQDATSTTGTSTAVSSTINRPRPSTPRA